MRKNQCSVIGPGQRPDHPKSLFLYFCLQIFKLHFIVVGRHSIRHRKIITISLRQLKEHGAESSNSPWGPRPQTHRLSCPTAHALCVFGGILPGSCCSQGSSRDANQHCQDLSVRTVTLKKGGVMVACFQNYYIYWRLESWYIPLPPSSRNKSLHHVFLLHFCFKTVQVAKKACVTAWESPPHQKWWLFKQESN